MKKKFFGLVIFILAANALFAQAGKPASQTPVRNNTATTPVKTTMVQQVLTNKKIVLHKQVFTNLLPNKSSKVEMQLKRVSAIPVSSAKPSNPKKTEDANWICTEEYVDQTNSDDNIALTPLSGEIYPGLIFTPQAFYSGTYQKVSQYSRKPMKLTVDGNCFAEKNIADPNEQNISSAVSSMRQSLKSKNCGVVNQSFLGKEILSEEDLLMKTAAAGSYMGISAELDASFESKQKTYKYLVDYTAPYYSIQTALDIKANNVFYLTTDNNNAANPINPGDIDPNWVYVKSVTYGKRLLAIVESNEDLEKVGVFVKGDVDYGLFSASASNSIRKTSALKQTTVKLFAIGGAQIGKNFVGLELSDIKNTIKGYLTSDDNNYQPLSFKLKTLDDELVVVQLSSTYTSRKCIPKTNKFRITWMDVQVQKADDNYSGNTEDVIAAVKVRAYDKNNKGIADIDNKVPATVYAMEETAPAGLAVSPVTFKFGSEANPKTLEQTDMGDGGMAGNVFGDNQPKITFAFPNNDYNGKIVISSYVTEYDATSANDKFDCGQKFTIKISDAPQGFYKIKCTHEGSIINLTFRIEPIY